MSVRSSCIVLAAAAGLAVAGFAQVAGAAYVIGPDDFSTYTANATIVGQNGWADSLGNGGPGATIVDIGGSHGQVLFIDNTTANSVDLAIPAAYSQSDLRIQYDVYGTDAPSGTTFSLPSMAVLGKDTVLNTGGIEVKLEGMGPGNSTPSIFRVNGENSNQIGGISSAQHTWYTVTIDLTLANPRSYSVTITDGVNTGSLTNIPYYYETVVPRPFTDWDTIRFQTNDYGGNPDVGAKGSGYFDNLSIQTLPVPEPASLSLLALGLIGLMTHRKR